MPATWSTQPAEPTEPVLLPDLWNCPHCVAMPDHRPDRTARWHAQVVRGCPYHSGSYDQSLLPDRATAISRMRDKVDPWVAPQ